MIILRNNGPRQRNSKPKDNITTRLLSMMGKNRLASGLATVMIVQLPFTVLYFVPKSRSANSVEQPQPKKHSTFIEVGGKPEKSRPDPFALLPSEESATPEVMKTPSLPHELEALTGKGIPAISQSLDIPANSKVSPSATKRYRSQAQVKTESVSNDSPASVNLAALSKPIMPDPPKPIDFKLTGVVRFHGRSIAVLKLKDGAVFYAERGDCVPGSDASVGTILPTKVLIKREFIGKGSTVWLFVGQ